MFASLDLGFLPSIHLMNQIISLLNSYKTFLSEPSPHYLRVCTPNTQIGLLQTTNTDNCGKKRGAQSCNLASGKRCREKRLSSTKKSKTFFHARISRSGKGRVSDFSATRVRVEGVGSPEWQKRSRTRPRPQVEFEKWKKVFFFGEDGIFFAKLAFSAVICGI
jgi:hypothetical protein